MKTKEIPANIGEYLKYDETSPTCLRWIKKFCDKINVGDIVGRKDSRGYLRTQFNGIKFSNHRIIFFLHNGYCPEYIDHIDGNPSNNKIENLRECSLSDNSCNTKISKNNTSGHKGVSKHNYGKHWRVTIIKNEIAHTKNFPINQFQEACDYADYLRKTLHGDFSNDGVI